MSDRWRRRVDLSKRLQVWLLVAAASAAAAVGAHQTFLPQNPDAAVVEAMPNSTFIECSGDIGAAVNNALGATTPERILIGVGRCTSSVDWTFGGARSAEIQGMGMGVTEVTFTAGGTTPAIQTDDIGCDGCYIANITLIVPAADTSKDIIQINGLSNTSALERIETRGGRDHLVFAPSSADRSSMWVGTVFRWTSVDAGRHAVRAGNDGFVRGQFIQPTIINSGSSAIYLPTMRHESNLVSFVDATLRNVGSPAVLVTNSGENPVVFLGGRTEGLGAGDTFISVDSELAVGIVDHHPGGDCDLLIDRPGTTEDVPCSATEKQVVPDGSGGDTVTNITEADRLIWRKWQRQILTSLTPPPPWWHFADTAETTHIACGNGTTSSGPDIGPDVKAALDAGKNVAIGWGRCDSSVNWTLAPGQSLIGHSMNRPESSGTRGTYIDFTSTLDVCHIQGEGDVYVGRIKLRSANNKQILCVKGLTGLLDQLYFRNGAGSMILQPDANNVVADGGVIRQILGFDQGLDGTVGIEGVTSKARFTMVGMDIGISSAGRGPHFVFDSVDPTTSAISVVGNNFGLFQTSPNDRVLDLTNSGRLPFLGLMVHPNQSTTADVFVTDSDAAITSLGGFFRYNPLDDTLMCDLHLDKPGTADDVACTFYSRTILDLVDF